MINRHELKRDRLEMRGYDFENMSPELKAT